MDQSRRYNDEIEAFAIFNQIVDEENAFAFLGAALANGQ